MTVIIDSSLLVRNGMNILNNKSACYLSLDHYFYDDSQSIVKIHIIDGNNNHISGYNLMNISYNGCDIIGNVGCDNNYIIEELDLYRKQLKIDSIDFMEA
jgi:hypothetical protein